MLPDQVTVFEDIVSMNEALDLVGIVFFQVSATRDEGEPPEDKPLPPEGTFETDWGIKFRHEGDEFGVRIRAELDTEFGDILIDVAAEYEAKFEFESPSRELALEFVNNIALMQIYPYVRESVTTIGSKVFATTLIMPTFQRGEIEFTL
jgi:hypothetical protein